MWPPRRTRLNSEEKITEPPQRPQRRRKTRRRLKPFIESKAVVDGDASDDETDGNNDLADVNVLDNVEY